MSRNRTVPVRPSRDNVRTRILDAASDEFAAKGFADARVDAIAEAAGFTKGAVYSNFGGKDDLFYALLHQQIDSRTDLAVAVLADLPPTVDAAIAELGARLTASIGRNREWQMLFFEYWVRAMRDPQRRAAFAEHRRAVRAQITERVEFALAQTSVRLEIPVDQMALVILALTNGLSVEALADDEAVPATLLGEVLRGLLTRPPHEG
ncbi:TetR/AcrR family transcriptional regulator [Williamsia sp. Leaf354]|uniref:TetR/AcrR family transcriptional regulator n=1 Tax=Williamsia sp. Leaf354 TaxID=1736349 RepID=UPI0009EAD054|nr:TetR/AcrR family transcriptional regulator [Williamsia sp. Leaf354]